MISASPGDITRLMTPVGPAKIPKPMTKFTIRLMAFRMRKWRFSDTLVRPVTSEVSGLIVVVDANALHINIQSSGDWVDVKCCKLSKRTSVHTETTLVESCDLCIWRNLAVDDIIVKLVT